jgi:hypothetical protein
LGSQLLLAQQAFLKDTIVQHETDHAEVAGLFGLLEASGWELEQDLADKKRASELNLQVRPALKRPHNALIIRAHTPWAWWCAP